MRRSFVSCLAEMKDIPNLHDCEGRPINETEKDMEQYKTLMGQEWKVHKERSREPKKGVCEAKEKSTV